MATVVDRSEICLTSFNSPTPKTPYEFRRYLLYKPSYRDFVSNFVAIATGVKWRR